MSEPRGEHDYGRRAYDRAPPEPARQDATQATPAPRPAPETPAPRAKPPEPRPAPARSEISPRLPRRLAWLGIVALVAALLAAVLLFWHRHHTLAREADRRQDEVAKGPRVFVAEARLSDEGRELTLPADVRGFLQATVYAKIAGYVKTMRVDKGDRVTPGEVLGVLESPEVDHQVAAAEADLVIKRRTFERYRALVKTDYVSVQDFETARAQSEVSEATLRQTKALQAYKTLRAPFGGIVTARYVDPGALVPAATGSTQAALPLVDVADLRRLRILVFVQQDAAPFVQAGDPVHIAIDQQPNVRIDAPISLCAKALDPRTRTMLCEVWIDNRHDLYPGTFVHATLRLRTTRVPVVPSEALLVRNGRPAVAVVGDGRLRFKPVKAGLDDGKTVQILDGLAVGERVALAPPASVADGAVVQAVEQKKPTDGGGGPQGKPR
ncbi:MAG TPA: efflux RND transporter periplasmic adaptor subunit [Polyangia bacterium]|nr:efflux RND transporter periplasmic adaptor subunit [Polyangia bacterium]